MQSGHSKTMRCHAVSTVVSWCGVVHASFKDSHHSRRRRSYQQNDFRRWSIIQSYSHSCSTCNLPLARAWYNSRVTNLVDHHPSWCRACHGNGRPVSTSTRRGAVDRPSINASPNAHKPGTSAACLQANQAKTQRLNAVEKPTTASESSLNDMLFLRAIAECFARLSYGVSVRPFVSPSQSTRNGNGSSFVTYDPRDPSHTWPMTHMTHVPWPMAIRPTLFHLTHETEKAVAWWYWTILIVLGLEN